MEELRLLETAATVAALVLIAAIGVALYRLVRGPDLADRVVALDLVSLLAVGFAGVTAIATGRSAYLDVGIALALVAFLATLAFAWYIERKVEAGTCRSSIEPPDREGS